MGDYTTTSYGATGGMNGGGFMANSQGDDSASKKGAGKEGLRPVTIKQIHDAHYPYAQADHYIIDGAETTQITFVAQIQDVSLLTTNLTYKMDDGTGIVEVKIWLDSGATDDPDDPKQQERERLVKGAYARVFGKMRDFNDKRHVGATIIRPISDFNEISYHLLEATYVHLQVTRGPPGAAQANTTATTSNGDHNKALSGASVTAKKVYNCIRTTPQQNEGLHVQNIASVLGIDANEVARACEELNDLGAIYTTVDENTFATLDL